MKHTYDLSQSQSLLLVGTVFTALRESLMIHAETGNDLTGVGQRLDIAVKNVPITGSADDELTVKEAATLSVGILVRAVQDEHSERPAPPRQPTNERVRFADEEGRVAFAAMLEVVRAAIFILYQRGADIEEMEAALMRAAKNTNCENISDDEQTAGVELALTMLGAMFRNPYARMTVVRHERE